MFLSQLKQSDAPPIFQYLQVWDLSGFVFGAFISYSYHWILSIILGMISLFLGVFSISNPTPVWGQPFAKKFHGLFGSDELSGQKSFLIEVGLL